MAKKVHIFAANVAIQDAFMQGLYMYPLVKAPTEVDLMVTVDGKEIQVHITCRGSGRADMTVVIAESPAYVWNLDYPVEKHDAVRLLVGGVKPELPEHLINTSWVAEATKGWLQQLVAKYLKPRFISPYKTQAEQFVSDIEAVREYLSKLLEKEIIRPTHHMANISFKRNIPNSLLSVSQNHEHPVFRTLFKCAFGQGSAFHRENHCIIVLHKTLGGWFGIYFTE